MKKPIFVFSSMHKNTYFYIQFYTANRLILESQTANRIMTTPGVLPDEMYAKLKTADESKKCSG